MMLSPNAGFELARQLQSADGAPLGEVFSFVSGLYFRGKLAYARRFARPPDPADPVTAGGVLVITTNSGLRAADTAVTVESFRAFALGDIDLRNESYRRPLEKSARTLREAVGPDMPLMLDAHHDYTREEALYLGRALEELNYYWLEEPINEHSISSYVWLSNQLTIPIVGPDSGGFLVAIALITGLVLGGASTISGAVIGGLAIVWLPALSKEWSGSIPFLSDVEGPMFANVLYGVLLIVVTFVMPGGVISFVRRLRSKFIRFVPDLPARES